MVGKGCMTSNKSQKQLADYVFYRSLKSQLLIQHEELTPEGAGVILYQNQFKDNIWGWSVSEFVLQL